jgi:hypothetical protein
MHQAEIVGREEELQARGASARVEAHVTDVFPGRLRDELQKFALPRHSTKYVELSVGAPGRPAEHGVHRFAVRRLVHAEPNSGDSDRCAEIDLDPLRRSIPSVAVAQYAHDSLLLFARIYRLAGYAGRVAAVARLDGVPDTPSA